MKTQKLSNSNETKSIETQTGAATAPATHVWREPTQRILHIHGLVAAGKFPNTTTLAHEFGISTRTVLRDLDYMRDKFHLPLEYDRQNFGFRYTEPVKHPPGMADLSQREMFALLVADKLVAQYRGTPFGAHLDDAFRRVACYLSPEQRYSIEGLAEALSIRPFAPDEPDVKTMRIVSQALMGQQVLRFAYRKPGQEAVEEREVHPYHMVCGDNRWYLLAYDEDRADVRTFVLNRMQQPELTARHFQRDSKFRASEYLRSVFRVMHGEHDYEVVVEFDAWATDVMRGRQLRSVQKIEELPGGRSRVTLRVSCLEEVRRWVLEWEEHATVIAPEPLRRSLEKVAWALADKYNSEVEELAA